MTIYEHTFSLALSFSSHADNSFSLRSKFILRESYSCIRGHGPINSYYQKKQNKIKKISHKQIFTFSFKAISASLLFTSSSLLLSVILVASIFFWASSRSFSFCRHSLSFSLALCSLSLIIL